MAAKRVICYLNLSKDLELCYNKKTDGFIRVDLQMLKQCGSADGLKIWMLGGKLLA